MSKSSLITASNVGIYEDKFIRIDSRGITLDLYFFPFGSKFIAWREIKSISIRSATKLPLLEGKGWGMALSDIWWACDLSRQWSDRTLVVIEVHDEWIRKGASIESRGPALRAIQNFAPTVKLLIELTTNSSAPS